MSAHSDTFRYPRSCAAFTEAQALIPGGVNSPVRAFRNVDGTPLYIERAQGAYLWDVDGNQFIDYVGTWGPAILGHAPEPVLQGLRRQLLRGISYGAPHEAEIEMAKAITAAVPSIEKVRMVNSGTEATMSAIRLARGFTGRDKIVKFEGCYHGHADHLLVKAGSGALSHGQPDSAGVPAAFAALTLTLPFNDIEALRALFAREGREIAGVILEPIPGNAGLYPPQPGFLEELRRLCTEYEALLIFDEVMTGFRVARGGAQALYDIRPDLTTLGKVIGGGLPVGAFGGRAEVMDYLSPIGPVYQAGTLSGNPLALAAGLAQLRELDRLNGWARLEALGAELEARLEPALRRSPRPVCLQRVGSMFCLFFTGGPVRNLAEAQRSDLDAFRRFFHHCLARGVYLAPSQFEAGFLSLAHTGADLAKTAAVMTEALEHA